MKKQSTISIFLLVFMIMLSLFFGYEFSKEHFSSQIFLDIVLPRTLVALLVGGGLAVVGWLFQIFFKNSLATPYTMGISSVAAVSLALSELLKDFSILSEALALMIYVTCILMMIFIYYFLVSKKFDRNRLLLFGVCVGIVSSSLIVFIQSTLGNESVAKLVRWMMGSVDVFGMSEVFPLLLTVFIFSIIIFKMRKDITLISIGSDFASTRGVNVKKTFNISFILSNLLIAQFVWICGPIGFIGLIVPHFVKRLISNDFSKGWLFCFCFGAVFLLLATFLSKNLIAYHVVPVGALTALIGAPLLIWQIVKSR